MDHDETVETLRAVCAAFDRHDLDGILRHFADDAVFESPRGPDPWGQRFVGIDEVRRGFQARFDGIPDVRYTDGDHFADGDRGASEWTLSGTMTDGTPHRGPRLRPVDPARRSDRQEGLVLEDPDPRLSRLAGVALARLDLANEAIARSVLDLQRVSYAIEAALIGDDRIPPLSETLADLREAGLDWLGASDDSGLAGAVAWRELDDGTVDIYRLVVAPRAFRRGIATALLDGLEALAPARRVLVSTGRANAPAVQLYLGRGFFIVRELEAIPGLWITELERPAPLS